MKLVFAGTPHFAAGALASLSDAGHEVSLVLTQPDRPSGRGMKLHASAVSQEALRLGIGLAKPTTLKDDALQTTIRDLGADIMVVAAYGLLLPQAVLELPRLGCLNIHASLLPRWRGAAPLQRAIEAGDSASGISIMQMDAGLDTGAILLEKEIAIAPDETSASLLEKLTRLGATTIVEALANFAALKARPQPLDGITYAKKIEKSEARIDWTQPAAVIERRIRAFDPFPGCEAIVGDAPLKIWHAQVVTNGEGGSVAPGTVSRSDQRSLTVQCGQHQLKWITVQRPGGKRMPASEYLRATAIEAGTLLT